MRKAYTINNFCKAYDISRSHYYKLKELGKAPKTFQVGSRQLISNEAAEEWQKALEA